MKILFIFTGGTIGSTRCNDVISPDRSKSYKIIDAYNRKYTIDFEYEISEPYVELSENNTGRQIKALCRCVKESVKAGYDGVIVTHGSDTLQYSAAAVGYCIGLDSIPVCLVASCAPIEDENSNALDNLRGAVRFIEGREGRGAFAIYRNSTSDRVIAHRATRLIGSKAYSDELSSVGECAYGEFDESYTFRKNLEYREELDAILPFDPDALGEYNAEALVLFSYPGMTYPKIGERVKYIIFNTYHSGTLNTASDEAKAFFETAKGRGIPIFSTGVSQGAQYRSAVLFEELGITPIVELSPVAAYVKLWLACASDRDLSESVRASLSGDLF